MSTIPFSQLVDAYLFETLDIQILKKIPYCLFTPLLFFIAYYFKKSYIQPYIAFLTLFFTILSIGYLLLFLWSTYKVNRGIDEELNSIFQDLDWKKFNKSFTEIFNGKKSLYSDIQGALGNDSSGYLLLSGFTLFYIISIIIGILLFLFNFNLEILLVLLLVTIILMFQDSLKNSPLNDLKPQDTPDSLTSNLLNTYSIDNTIKNYKIPKFESKILLHIIARTFGPLIFIPEQNFAIERIIIYWNEEITNIFERYSNENANSDYFFEVESYYFRGKEQSAGSNLVGHFFNHRNGESIRGLITKSPRKLFYYLLDPEEKPLGDKRESGQWLALKIKKKDGDLRTVGYIIVHSFKGLILKNRPRKKYTKKSDIKDIEYILLYGEKSFISFFKSQLLMNSKQYPLNLLPYEPEEID